MVAVRRLWGAATIMDVARAVAVLWLLAVAARCPPAAAAAAMHAHAQQYAHAGVQHQQLVQDVSYKELVAMLGTNKAVTVLFYRSKGDRLWREFVALGDTPLLAPGVELVTYNVHDVSIYRQFKLDSVPIVKVFHGSRGVGVTYKGPVSMENLATWVSYYQHSAVAKVETMAEYEHLQGILQTFLVGAFAELGSLYGTFHEAAAYDEIPFVATTNASLALELGMPVPSIMLSKDEALYAAARRSQDVFNFNTRYAAQGQLTAPAAPSGAGGGAAAAVAAAAAASGSSASASSASGAAAGDRASREEQQQQPQPPPPPDQFPLLRRSFNRSLIPYVRNLSCADAIDSFVLHNQLPGLVVEYSVKTARKLFDTTYSRFVLLFAFEGTSSLDRLLDTFHTIAGWLETREGGSMRQVFVHVPSYQAEAWAFFGVREEDSPAVVFYETVRGGMPQTGPAAHGAMVPGVHDKLPNIDAMRPEWLIGYLDLSDSNSGGRSGSGGGGGGGGDNAAETTAPTALHEFSLYKKALEREAARAREAARNAPPTAATVGLGPRAAAAAAAAAAASTFASSTAAGAGTKNAASAASPSLASPPLSSSYSPPFQAVTQENFEPHVLDPTHDVLVFFCPFAEDVSATAAASAAAGRGGTVVAAPGWAEGERERWGAFLLIMLDVARLFQDVESLNVVLVWRPLGGGGGGGSDGLQREEDGVIRTSVIPEDAQTGLVLFPAYNKDRPVLFTGPVQADAVFQFIQAHAKNLFILADGRLGGGSVPIEIQKNGRVLSTKAAATATTTTVGASAGKACAAGGAAAGEKVLGFGGGEDGIRAWFAAHGLGKWVAAFLEMGVEDVSDLKFVTVEDMQGLGMPLIQQRKFKAAFKASAAAAAAAAAGEQRGGGGDGHGGAGGGGGAPLVVDGWQQQQDHRNQWQQRKTSATLI